MNDYYIYREYENIGREIRLTASSEFKTLEELFEFMNIRKSFYNSYWDMRKIEIEIVRSDINGYK